MVNGGKNAFANIVSRGMDFKIYSLYYENEGASLSATQTIMLSESY